MKIIPEEFMSRMSSNEMDEENKDSHELNKQYNHDFINLDVVKK
jgi:hypothetical protein